MKTRIWSKDDRVSAECDCGCCELQFKKQSYTFEHGIETSYDVSIVDSYYDHNPNSLFGRLRRAWGILIGKPVIFNDVYLIDDEFDALLVALQKLRDE